MTHRSSFRYGNALAESYSGGKSGEVRVGYFDPVTGEPRDTKPEPLRKKGASKQTSYEKSKRRAEAEAEAAEIMRNMRKRNSPREKLRHGKRPVLVDGMKFPTVNAAAKEIGTSAQYLGNVLLAGRNKLKGRKVEFAEEED